jgi:hypothetical protein
MQQEVEIEAGLLQQAAIIAPNRAGSDDGNGSLLCHRASIA